MSAAPLKVGVVGATGYVGAEIVRWLLAHPALELATVVSGSRAGTPIAAVHPGLEGLCDLVLAEFDAQALAVLDAVFLAVPHGAARPFAQALDAAGTPIIVDASRDHRHAPGWIYGQPEWNAELLAGATRIAAPGCFATAIALAIAPFVDAGVVSGPVTVAAATGSTGSGAAASAGTHHPLRFTNLKAYKVLGHQHVPEIRSFLATLGEAPPVSFVPISAPIDRGILATCFVPVSADVDAGAILRDAYASHPLIRVRSTSPELRHVRGTALCDVAAFRQADASAGGADDVVAVISAIDNLGRGAAAQAVQALQTALGLTGPSPLHAAPLLP
mgnify:CR=1 FL=1